MKMKLSFASLFSIAALSLGGVGTVSTIAHAGFERVELTVPGSVLAVATGDLDGDKLTDLVVSYHRGRGPKAERFLAVFFRGPKGYQEKSSIAFLAPKNAVVFDIGDALPGPGQELVYLASDGIYAQSFAKRLVSSPHLIVQASTLVGAPEEEDLFTWDLLRNIAGQSKPILLVPQSRGLAFYRANGSLWSRIGQVTLNAHHYYDAESPHYRRSRRGGSSGRPYTMRATTILPNIDFVDQTGDNKTDLVTHFEDRVFVYAAQDDLRFPSAPTHRRWFSIRTEEESETRDAEVSAIVRDLDEDGVADIALTKISGGINSLKTESLIYRGRKGGGFDERPAQSFRDDGFAALVQFQDVDGDNKLEMIHPQARVSIMAITKMMISSSLTVDFRIRKMAESPQFFSASPKQTLDSTVGLDLSVGATLVGAYPILGHDFDGDGIRDAIVAQGPKKMMLYPGKNRGRDFFDEDGRITLRAPGTHKVNVVYPKPGQKGLPDVLLYYVGRPELSQKLFVFKNNSKS